MVQLLDFYPFNIESGPTFLWFYLIFGSLAVILLLVVKNLVARVVDGGSAESTGRSSSARRLLRIGSAPRSEDAYAIAYLQGKEDAVANTLVSEAVAAGWLKPSEASPGSFNCSAAGPSDRTPATFHKVLTTHADGMASEQVGGSLRPGEVVTLARSQAAGLAPDIVKDLKATGFLRSEEDKAKIRTVVLLGGAIIIGVGVVRLIRAMALGRPAAFLVVEIAVFFVAVWAMRKVGDMSTARDAYLAWLENATQSLRADVGSGRRRGARDVALAVAVAGVSGLAAVPVLAAMMPAMMPPRPVVSDSSSWTSSSSCSSTSSCSSSSDSSGGGCGSGGCGGGGGCGG